MIYITIFSFLLITAGFLGIIIPAVPDFILIFSGILLYAIGTHFDKVGWLFVVISAIITVIMFVLDYIGQAIGAKKFGASKFGIIGSIIGAIVGLVLFSFLGMIVGSILGTFVAEIIWGKKNYSKALKAGVGAFLGFIFISIVKIIIAIILISIFLIKIF